MWLRNKRGEIIDLIIVLMVIVMFAIVLVGLSHAESSLNASLVSPVSVLDLSVKRSIFEGSEFVSLKNIYCEGFSGDAVSLKKKFCSGFGNLEGVSFLTSNIQPKKGFDFNSGSPCDSIYEFELSGSDLRVFRSGLMKSGDLKATSSDSKNKFEMGYEFNLEKEYLLTKEDCKE